VLGSVATSGYASRIAGSLTGLPSTAAAAARNSIGGALGVAQSSGGGAGSTLANAARHAYVGAMRPSMLVAVAVTLAGALIVMAFLPARAVDESDAPSEVAVEAAVAAGSPVAPVGAVPALASVEVDGDEELVPRLLGA
jgi:hypothetical protein